MKTALVITGNTYDHKEQLKRQGFRWHGGDKAWVLILGDETALHVAQLREMFRSLTIDEQMADPWLARDWTRPTGYQRPQAPRGMKAWDPAASGLSAGHSDRDQDLAGSAAGGRAGLDSCLPQS